MVATHIFHKLVDSARLFMKKASWGSFVSELDSSGDLAGQPELNDPCAQICSGTEVEVGRTSGEDNHGAAVVAPMDFESSMHFSTCSWWGRFGQSHLCCFCRSSRSPRG